MKTIRKIIAELYMGLRIALGLVKSVSLKEIDLRTKDYHRMNNILDKYNIK